MADKFPQTLSIPEAGKRYFGLSRNGSYDAALRGDIPFIKIGRLKRVPVRTMEHKLNQLTEQQLKKETPPAPLSKRRRQKQAEATA